MASVLVLSFDTIGQKMAGTGIRYWNLARILAREHQVTLAAPSAVDLPSLEGVDVREFPEPSPGAQSLGHWQAGLIAEHDIVVGQDLPYYECDSDLLASRRLVIDLYAPAILEKLELARVDPERGDLARADDVRSLNRLLSLGDFFLCASERQRDLWLGALAAAGRLSRQHAQRDPELRELIDVVSFGLPDDGPIATGPGPRDVIPGIGHDDLLLLWNGGLWSWLDPCTAIRAVGRLTTEMPRLRLVFMGARNPLRQGVQVDAVEQARSEARRLGLLDRHIFFHDWVPYEERQNWLLEADAAISLHVPTAESRFAFRTRMMDLLWCGVPVIATEGDVIADLVRAEGIGIVVPPRDEEQAACAIRRVADRRTRDSMRSRFTELSRQYTWERVAEPLLRYCRTSTEPDPERGADPMTQYIHQLERTYQDTADYARHLESEIDRQRAAMESGWGHRVRVAAERIRRAVRVR